MENSEFEKEVGKPSPELRLTPMERAAGGTCNAYSARLFGKKIFVKEIKPEYLGDARMLAAFRKEAEIGFRLDHRNLPQYIYAEGVLPSDRYIVQEFIDGLTLSEFVRENPTYFQNGKNVERFIRELADVIDYLHSNQVVHLDLKPENILISRVGKNLKLIDLGFCASDFYDDTRGLTRSELAPEGSMKPEARGVASDYYGIGKILRFIRENTHRFPQKRFRKLETRLLLPEPTKRLASKEDIEKALENQGIKGRIWLIILAVALALVALIGAGIFYKRFSVQPTEVTPTSDTAVTQTSPIVDDAEPSITTKENKTIEKPAERVVEEEKNPVVYADENQKLPNQTYEQLKVEMEGNINKNFASFEKMLSAYLRDGKFTEKDYKILIEAYKEALQKTFDTTPYKTRYPDLSDSLIDDTMADMLEKAEKRNWGPNFKKYIARYQEFSAGSSR